MNIFFDLEDVGNKALFNRIERMGGIQFRDMELTPSSLLNERVLSKDCKPIFVDMFIRWCLIFGSSCLTLELSMGVRGGWAEGYVKRGIWRREAQISVRKFSHFATERSHVHNWLSNPKEIYRSVTITNQIPE